MTDGNEGSVDWEDGVCMQKPMQRVEIGREERGERRERGTSNGEIVPFLLFDQDITPAENLRN